MHYGNNNQKANFNRILMCISAESL